MQDWVDSSFTNVRSSASYDRRRRCFFLLFFFFFIFFFQCEQLMKQIALVSASNGKFANIKKTHNEYVIPSTYNIYVHAHLTFVAVLILGLYLSQSLVVAYRQFLCKTHRRCLQYLQWFRLLDAWCKVKKKEAAVAAAASHAPRVR